MPKRSTKPPEPVSSGNGADGSHPPDLTNGFLVVGIGASAGGVQALSTFFENVKSDSGMAYVVILHLSPDHDSHLSDVLQNVAAIPVTQVTQRTKVEPNRVYVVPPDRHLAMEDGHIVVKPQKTVEERRAPVDIFFRTLADTHGPYAVGVILSGTGANGSMGIKRIKEFGGAAFVQNPREAEHNEMPRNSIATELVDAILPVAQIPAAIASYRDNRGTIFIPDEPADRQEEQQTALRDIFAQLRVKTGHDFSNYKRPTMLRRIERRISVRGLADLRSYADYVRESPDESQALLKDLLISVTNFFRDKKAFDAIEKNIFPRLLLDRSKEKPIRIWVAGCATGEEAYSIAMIAAEQTMGNVDAPPVQIFATDIDEQAIAFAREGLYTLNDAADVSPERLRRFFSKEGESYRIRREIRETVLFAPHNLIKDPPFSHLDLITCRNLLIYLNPIAQERVMETVHFALRPGGYLFIGSSESVDGSGDLFRSVDKENHIYQSRHVSAKPFVVPESVPNYRAFVNREIPDKKSGGRQERITYNDLHLRLLEEFAPPSLVVNEEYDVVYLSERAGKYLQVAGGELSSNLLRLIRPGLRLEMRTALFQAVQQQTNVEVKGTKVRIGDQTETINLLIRPVTAESDTARGFILVVFEPAVESDGHAVLHPDYVAPEPVAKQLEEELVRSRTQLQSALEQSEVQAEELRASNEELQAMNEELRSSAEELETSKEELQSINEELTTVNQELKVKIEELSQTNNNFQNLLTSIDIGVIFLDRGLRVNLFSPAAREIFNLIPNDVGRPITDITHRLERESLQRDADHVLEKLQSVEREVRRPDGRTFMMRMSPYRTVEDRINGVVVTFVDISERKEAEVALSHSEEQFRRAIEDAPIPVIMHAEDGEVLQISRTWTKLTGYTLKDVPTLDAWLTRACGEGADDVRAHMHELFKGDKKTLDIEFPVRTRNGETRYWSFSASSPGALRDGRRFIVGMAVDITDRRMAEDELRESEEKYRTLFSSIDEGFCIIEMIFDDAGRPVDFSYVEANDGFERQTGRRPQAGQTMRELFPEAEDMWLDTYAEVASTGKPKRFVDYNEGLERWYEVYIFPTKEASEKAQLAALFSDVTDQKLSERALRENQDLLQKALSIETIGVLFFSLDGRIQSANDTFVRMVGYSREELLGGLDWSVLTAPEFTGINEKVSKQLASRGETRPFEKEMVRKDGSRWWGLFAPTRISGEGKDSRCVEFIVDITDRKLAEEAMRESEETLRITIEAAEMATWEWNIANNTVRWNDRHYTILGMEPGDGTVDPDEFFKRIHPDDAASVRAGLERTINEQVPFESEFRVVRDDGEVCWMSGYGRVTDEEGGRATAVSGVMYDVTSRKRAEYALRASEERLRLLMDSFTDVALFTTDTNAIITAWNPGAEKIFGFTGEEMVGKQSADIVFTPEDRAKGEPEKERREAWRNGKALDERWHLRKDGSRFFATGFMVPLTDGENLIGYGKIASDLTERKRYEDDLKQAHEELEGRVQERTAELAEMNESLRRQIADRKRAEQQRVELLRQIVTMQEDERRRIARDIHDQMGQRLTALRLQMASLKDQCEDDDLCKQIEKLQELGARIDSEVNFLAWELRPTVLDDLGLITAVENFVHEWSQHFGIKAEFHSTGLKRRRLDSEVETNLYRITQEALNNVYKHSAATAVNVLLELRRKEVVLIIEDNGIGFDVEKQKLDRRHGSAMGLLGMHERAAIVGGTVEIESGAEKGTTVFARIPARFATEKADDKQ